MSDIIFAVDKVNKPPQPYAGPKGKPYGLWLENLDIIFNKTLNDADETQLTWIELLFKWESVEYKTVSVTDALSLSHPWFYHIQIQHWSDLIGLSPPWQRMDPAVQDAIRHGNAYWIISFALEGELDEPLNKILKILRDNYIPEQKVLFVTGASNLPNNIPIHTSTVNVWQSKLRNIWQRQTGLSCTQDIGLPNTVDKRYICFNRKPRPQRIALVSMLFEQNLLDHGFVSCHIKTNTGKEEEYIRDSFRNYIGKGCFTQDTAKKIRNILPLALDYNSVTEIQSLTDFNEMLYRRSYFSIVTETFFCTEQTFITEKIFRPIMFGHPFVVLSTPGYLAALRKLGYETFPELFNESYDQIEDHADRLRAVTNEVARLCAMPEKDLRKILVKILPKLQHNRSHFFAKHPPSELLMKLNSLIHEHQFLL